MRDFISGLQGEVKRLQVSLPLHLAFFADPGLLREGFVERPEYADDYGRVSN